MIVAGGGGVGSKDNFHLIHELAGAIGGAVGASRAAVDGGYIGKEHQIGQTGTTVRPALYIAAGISGAVQHRAGMEESAKIIAINTDPEAPIFSVAHYGIVGDLKQVIPMLVKALKEQSVRTAVGNFFLDNQDIQFLFSHLDLPELARVQERFAENGDADYVPARCRKTPSTGTAGSWRSSAKWRRKPSPRTPNRWTAKATRSTTTAR